MKILLMTMLVLAVAPIAAAQDLMGEPMVDLAGEAASLADYEGEILVVNFWASWCAPCREELPELDSWNTEWSGLGARVVAVSIDKKMANAQRFADEAGLDLAVLVDGPDGLAAGLDLTAVPSTYLLDRDGRVVMVVHGYDQKELARLKRAVEDLLEPAMKRRSA